jgi:hypothetical protein
VWAGLFPTPCSPPNHCLSLTPRPPNNPYNPLVAYQHPASLGAFQRFQQATAILKNTSRASDPAWYQDPLDLDYQWHIRHDGASCIACFFDRETAKWSQALSLPEALLSDPAQRKAFVTSAIRDAQLKIPKAIGVILYLANDFATSELKSEFDNPSALQELRAAAESDPRSILEDASLDTDNNSFRILPLPAGQGSVATAVTHSRILAPLLDDIREVSATAAHPVVVKALSAPLVVLMGLPSLITSPTGKPFVTILQYPWFTVLAFFNEHKDLMLVRTIQHKGIRRVGSLRSAITASCASLEIIDPDLYIFPLAEEQDTTTEERIRSVSPTSRITTVLPTDGSEALPDYCSEPFIALSTLSAPIDESVSRTFTTLRSEGWALQDILPMLEEEAGIYPTYKEMRLLKRLRRSRIAFVVVLLALLGYLANGIWGIMRKEEWKFDPSQAKLSKVQVTKLTEEQQRVYHWNNVLEDRSKAWISMEVLARLASENRGLLIRNFSHIAKPDSASGVARVGMVREWRISGFARDESTQFLNHLNTREGAEAFFKEIADATDNSSYRPGQANRNITLNLRTVENGTFKPETTGQSPLTDESTYPYTFDMTITQRFESSDPMALNVTAAP